MQQLAVDIDQQIAIPLIELLLHKLSQPAREKPFVNGAAFFIHRFESRRHLDFFRDVRFESRSSCSTSAYQCFAQTPSVVAPTRRPRKHRSVKLHARPLRRADARVCSGFSSTSRASITGGSGPYPRPHAIEKLRLLRETRDPRRRLVILLQIGNDHFARIANQKTIHDFAAASRDRSPAADDASSVSDKRCASPSRHRASQMRDHFPPIRFALRDHFLRARMRIARAREIKRIERFVDHGCIRAIAPGPHHRGRDVARPGPHRDSDRLIHGGRE